MKIRNLLAAAALAGTLISGSAYAATISANALWPDALDPDVFETVDVFTIDTAGDSGGRGLGGAESLRQTFVPSNTINDVTDIYLSWKNYGGGAFSIKLYEVAVPEADILVFGTQVGSTINVPGSSSVSGATNLNISLGVAEQFSVSGGSGYALVIDGSDGTPGGGWRFVDDGTTDYATGRGYEIDPSVTALAEYEDFGLALVGTSIPEPSTLGMLGCAVFGLLLRRRR